MRKSANFCWLGLVILIALLVLAVTGPVMREGDQAALLEGAVELARSGDFVDRGLYNYDKQYLSFWVLAGVFQVTGLDAPGADPASVVRAGNWAAALFFNVCFLIAFAQGSRRSLAALPVALAVFLTPAFIFSVPLLASNIFSAGGLLLLAAALSRRRGKWLNALWCGLLTAIAVGFRRDAALALPLLCLLSTTHFSMAGLLRERRHWLMGGAALGMVALGMHLGTDKPYAPDTFFDLRLFGAYLVFGMAGAAVVLFWLPFRLLCSKRRRFLRGLTAVAMLAPFLFYSFFLYTPRHFFLSSLMLLLVVLLPRGELWWRMVMQRRLDRTVVWTAVTLSAVLWLVGARFESSSSARPVMAQATLYPTADGFWPMGGYRDFLVRLQGAAREPIDHNQEVWDLWTQLDTKRLPAGKAHVQSAGLRAYGHLALKILGREYATGGLPGDFHLVPDRSVGRSRPGFVRSGAEQRYHIDWESCWLEELVGTPERALYLVNEHKEGQKRFLNRRWVGQLAFVKALGADDFHIRHAALAESWLSNSLGVGHRVAVIFDSATSAAALQGRLGTDGEASVKEVKIGELEVQIVSFVYRGPQEKEVIDLVRKQGIWLARSLLPAFMSRANY